VKSGGSRFFGGFWDKSEVVCFAKSYGRIEKVFLLFIFP
jgi:hypothetical protein